ncbi:hypothetical protein [Pseudescherichia vulneris]|uniref:hypothetical protein n=1 Tax=Pseudescherichia vulneris TaxID=566 RepID=UPI0028AA96EA|nr:hypothetical protein [Pseudescherichia vulneris]
MKTLEEKVESLVTDVAVMKSNYATKEDTSTLGIEVANFKVELHNVFRVQTMIIIGSMIAITGVASGVIIKFLAH